MTKPTLNVIFRIQFSLFLILLMQNTFSQVFVNANGTNDPYNILNGKGWYEEETSLHPGVKHITQQWDTMLKKYVFAFAMHKDIDGDGAERIDRQRLEIKTYGKSPDNMKAAYGETHTYRWKFKLDADFQPSPSFCHIHQLKAGDGDDAGAPLITITPRKGTPDKLQIIFVAPTAAGGGTTYVKEVELEPFKGVWVEVQETVKFAHDGNIAIVIRRVEDDFILLQYASNLLDLWRGTATFIRPKYGIYRSLNLPYLRDETVLFADFSLYEGVGYSLPEAPSGFAITTTIDKQAKLSWNDNSGNEDQFRIEASDDGVSWKYFASVPVGTSNYTTSGLASDKKIWFRIRSENVAGSSVFSNTVSLSPITGMISVKEADCQFKAWYSNGFVCFSCHPGNKQTADFSLHSLQGTKIFSASFDLAQQKSQKEIAVAFLPDGVYIARLVGDDFSGSMKIFVNQNN